MISLESSPMVLVCPCGIPLHPSRARSFLNWCERLRLKHGADYVPPVAECQRCERARKRGEKRLAQAQDRDLLERALDFIELVEREGPENLSRMAAEILDSDSED